MGKRWRDLRCIFDSTDFLALGLEDAVAQLLLELRLELVHAALEELLPGVLRPRGAEAE
jgi:hypothetical protein